MNNPEKLATQCTQGEDKKKQKKQKQKNKKNKKPTQYVLGHHYTQANTTNVNKTWTLIQTTGGKDESNIVFMQKSQNVKTLHVSRNGIAVM